MCRAKGIRLRCACKDDRCRDRREFLDWNLEGQPIKQHGHGWQELVARIDTLCIEGQYLISQGLMRWKDQTSREVDKVVPHPGLRVTWEYRWVNERNQSMICNICQLGDHKVT